MQARRFSLTRAVSALTVTALLCGPVAALPASASNDSPPTPAAETFPGGKPKAVIPAKAVGDQPERIIVKFKDSAQGSAAERGKAYGKAAAESGVTVKELRSTGTGATIVEATKDLTAQKAVQVAAALDAHPAVEYAEVDAFLRPAATPNDDYYPYQWDLHEDQAGMRVPGAWKRSTGAGTVVAVIDTGITGHSDLDRNLVPGYDFITDSSIALDGNGRDPDNTDVGDSCEGSPASWHGTHVAGTIGAHTDSSVDSAGNPAYNAGIVGVSYGAKVQPIRALGACGGWLSDIAAAVTWAAGGSITGLPANPTPAAVVNLSLGGATTCSTTFQNALNYAATKGAVVVAAAGNENSPVSGSTPANCDKVISVGATGREGNRAGYSNYGPAVDVSAPGGDFSTGVFSGILSTYNDGPYTPGHEAYGFMQGTSMAAPHVAGAAALMRSAAPALTPAEIEEKLKATARPLPGTCSTGGCGTGLVDTEAAVKSASPAPIAFTSTPAPSIGFAAVGQEVQAETSAGSWSPEPESFTYQWLRNGVAIPGATQTAYTPVDSDQSALLSFAVTATKYDHKTTTTKSEAKTVAERPNTPAPVIEGSPRVGATLTADVGSSWTPGPVTVQYQWLRGTAAITGATASSYTAVPADLGQILKVRVRGEGPNLAHTEVLSEASSAISEGVLTASTPEISGNATVGHNLQATPGTWTEGSTLSYQWLRNGTPIADATEPAYALTPADKGKAIAVRVTGTKDAYATDSRDSAQTPAVQAGSFSPPTPEIAGAAAVGLTLTADTGDWGLGTSLSYQWLVEGTEIAGATAATYALKAEDLDKTVTVRVTGVRDGYTTESRESLPTDAVQAGALEAPSPTVTGKVQVGSSLTATPGSWTSGTTFSYQWYRSGIAIPGATGQAYTLVAADLGEAISADVTGTNTGYNTETRESAPTAAVAPGTLTSSVPAVTGTAKVGYTLTAAPLVWTSGTAYSYQWYRSGVAITGATGYRYTLTAADLSKGMKVRVTGTKTAYTSAFRESAQTAAVAAGTLSAPTPGISGTRKVGYTLTAIPGAWTAGTTLRYQWYRSGTAITGATGSRYTLAAADLGKGMKVRVTGSKAGYTSVSRYSGQTAAAVAGTLSGPTPRITGTLRPGYVLTTNAGTWTAGTTLRYQWYRSGAPIKGATGRQYRLVTADRYDTMRVRVIGSKPGYTSLARYSGITSRLR